MWLIFVLLTSFIHLAGELVRNKYMYSLLIVESINIQIEINIK